MVENEWLVVMGLGGVFVLLGIAAVFWGRGEERSYYDTAATRPDLREFVEHQPEIPEPGSLKIGGWIAIGVGLLTIGIGGAFWLWG